MENTNECDFNNNGAGKKQCPYYDLKKNFLLEMVMMMILKLCINSKVVFDMVIESVTRNNKLDMIKQWTN